MRWREAMPPIGTCRGGTGDGGDSGDWEAPKSSWEAHGGAGWEGTDSPLNFLLTADQSN